MCSEQAIFSHLPVLATVPYRQLSLQTRPLLAQVLATILNMHNYLVSNCSSWHRPVFKHLFYKFFHKNPYNMWSREGHRFWHTNELILDVVSQFLLRFLHLTTLTLEFFWNIYESGKNIFYLSFKKFDCKDWSCLKYRIYIQFTIFTVCPDDFIIIFVLYY